MSRLPSNVVPIRPKHRKWTRPEDFGHDPRKAPKPPKGPKKEWRGLLRAAVVWGLILALIGGTIAYSVWS